MKIGEFSGYDYNNKQKLDFFDKSSFAKGIYHDWNVVILL